MNTKRRSVYRQLIFLFVIVILPFILLTSGLLFLNNRKQRQDTIESVALTTQNVIRNMDNSIRDIYKANFSLLGQSNVLKLSNRNTQLTLYEKMTAVKTLREQLSGIKTANSLTENIRIHFRDWGRVYNSAGYQEGSFQSFSPESYAALLEKAQTGYFADETQVSILITDTLVSNSASIVEVNLSTKNMRQIFQNLCTLEEDYYLFTPADSPFYLHNLPDPILNEGLAFLSSFSAGNFSAILDGQEYILFSEYLPSLNGRFLRLVPARTLVAPLTQLSVYTIIFFILVSSGCLAFFLSTRQLIRQPLIQLINGFEQVEKGDFSVRIPYNTKNDFSYLYHGFNQMTENIERSIEQDYKYKILLQQAELKQLQAQINPHFLYNSFFMLQRTIKGGLWEDADEIAGLLGKYFQYITRNTQDLVSLQDEYEHARIYAHIQGLRFDGRICVYFEGLPSPFRLLPVPKLILQPILENSFEYGLGNKLSDGILHVYFKQAGNTLKIFVDDNGDSLSNDTLDSLREKLTCIQNGGKLEMTGILNISRRLTLFSQSSSSLTVSRSSMGGLSACITLTIGENNHEPITDC